MNQWEREYEQIEKDCVRGRLTREEANKAIRQLERDQSDQARADAEEAAQQAYDDAMGRHYF